MGCPSGLFGRNVEGCGAESRGRSSQPVKPSGLVDRVMWTDDAIHRLDRMPPYLSLLVRDEVEQDMRARGERVVTYDIVLRPRTGERMMGTGSGTSIGQGAGPGACHGAH